jgi:type II secretory pathway pseudopilin PulG
MTARNSKQVPQCRQRGYALLTVIFLVATMMTFALMATISIKAQGQREKEEELAWRGNQYVRAIRLFYTKNGRFPKTLDELTAYHTDQPNFIRKAYKDPMNKADGTWRLIYLLPNGQLSGSVMHTQLQGALPIAGPLGGAAPASGTPTTGIGGILGTPQQPPTGTATQTPPSTDQPGTTSQANQSSSDSTVFGGSVIGVASKIKLPSLRIYKLGKSYFEWEFIYDPTANSGVLPGTPNGTPAGTQPPATPGQPGTPGQTGTPIQPQGPGQPQGLGQ